jgi:hypothetical protein
MYAGTRVPLVNAVTWTTTASVDKSKERCMFREWYNEYNAALETCSRRQENNEAAVSEKGTRCVAI